MRNEKDINFAEEMKKTKKESQKYIFVIPLRFDAQGNLIKKKVK